MYMHVQDHTPCSSLIRPPVMYRACVGDIRAAVQHAARVRVQSGVTAATTAARRLPKVDFRRNFILAYTTIPQRLSARSGRRFCQREERFEMKKTSRLAFACVDYNVSGIDRRGATRGNSFID